MLGDGGVRGATLEACLAKILYCAADTQIVGMSATLNNLQELATFLRASVYSNDFRPVELCEYVKVERCVYSVKVERGNVNFHPERDVQDFNAQMDRDQLCSLVMEVVPDSSCLLFCPTKKSCQNVATLLATCLPRFLREVKQQARYNLLKLLSIEAAGVCPILAQTIPYGVAYHHSGLTADERRIIEEAYLEGTLCLLACTSTLAAGVNLPAKRVIIRSPYVGNQFLTRSQYKQIIGRAGRAGLCRTGESILLLQHRDKEKVVDLLSGPYDQCSSSLLTGGAPALLSLILTLIGLKLVGSTRDLHLFFQSTLLQVQHDPGHLSLSCQETVSKLVAMGYITMETGSNPDVSTFKITSLGRATYKGCLPVEQAHIVYHNLVKAQQCLALSTDLHLLHLCTPPDLTSTITPNWMAYFETVTRLCPDDLQVAELVGISPGFLTKKATGTAGRMSDSSLSLYHQFYITLMLHSLLRASSPRAVWAVAEYFHCSRGFLQNIINSTAAFASCLVHFTEELPELWALHLLLPAIGKRLAFSASIELVPLMEIPGVKQGRAMQLLAAGYRTPQDIAAADPTTLSEQIEHMFPKNAKKLIHAAKVLLVDQAEALFEEAEELMSLAPQNSS